MAYMKWIPNLLSGGRIVIAFILLFVFSIHDETAFLFGITLATVALITDVLDGKIARYLGVESETGYVLDGLGDRSIYLSFILIGITNSHISIVIAWLLIFREISIYALRVLDRTCQPGKLLRIISLIHAGALRFWIVGMLVSDSAYLFFDYNLMAAIWFIALQTSLLSITIIVSYLGLSIQSYRLIIS